MTSFIVTSAPSLPELQDALDKALAPVLDGVIVASSLMAVEAARVNGIETVVSISYTPSSTTIASPYKARMFQARTPSGLESAAAAFVSANPGYFISPLQVCRVDSTRHISNFLGVVFYNTDMAQGALNWGLPAVPAGAPVAADVQTHSTGILTGGVATIGAGGAGVATTFSIAAGSGQVVDNSVYPPVVTTVVWAAKNDQAINDLGVSTCFFGISTSGNVVQQTTLWTSTQYRSLIQSGVATIIGGKVVAVANNPVVAYNPGNQLSDLTTALRFFNISGNAFTPAVAGNKKLDKASGTIHGQGLNYTGPSTNPPNIVDLGAVSNIPLVMFNQTGAAELPSTDLDTTNYNPSGGTSVAMADGSYTIHRLYLSATNIAAVQRGQNQYFTMAAAVASLQTEPFNVNPGIATGPIFRAYIIVQKGCANLKDATKAAVLMVGKFGVLEGTMGTTILPTVASSLLSSGGLTVPVVTVAAGGMLNAASFSANLNSKPGFDGDLATFVIPALVNHQLTANTYSYLTVKYNTGSPVYEVITDNTLINHSDRIAVANVYWEKQTTPQAVDEGHVFTVGATGLGLGNKTSHRLIHTQRFGWETGLLLSVTSPPRTIQISAGAIWYNSEYVPLAAVDTATVPYHFYYHVAGVWTVDKTLTAYNNLQYDNGTNLVAVNPNKWVNNFVYRAVAQGSTDTYVVLGTNVYGSQLEAEAAGPPASLPSVISLQTVLVGRISAQQNTNIRSVASAFATSFTPSGTITHNDTTGREVFGAHTHNAVSLAVRTVTGDATITTADYYVRYTGTGGHTSTLPAANVNGAGYTPQFFIRNLSAFNLSLTDGVTTLTVLPGQSVLLMSDGISTWDVN